MTRFGHCQDIVIVQIKSSPRYSYYQKIGIVIAQNCYWEKVGIYLSLIKININQVEEGDKADINKAVQAARQEYSNYLYMYICILKLSIECVAYCICCQLHMYTVLHM